VVAETGPTVLAETLSRHANSGLAVSGEVKNNSLEDSELSIGVGSGPRIGIQKGPPRFTFRAISVRPVGAGLSGPARHLVRRWWPEATLRRRQLTQCERCHWRPLGSPFASLF